MITFNLTKTNEKLMNKRGALQKIFEIDVYEKFKLHFYRRSFS